MGKRMPRSGVLVLCVRPTAALEALLAPLCPYHDVYMCCDAEDLETRPAQAGRPGQISLRRGQAEAAGFLGTVSWLPRRASSRCKALYWLCQREANSIHWWMIEEDVLIPTEAALLAMDAAHPTADLLSPHHYVKRSLSSPDAGHWSGQRTWSHWHRAAGLASHPLACSMVCAVRVSRALLERIADMARARRRLLFCEMLFNTLAEQGRLRVETPFGLSGILWREPRYRLGFSFRPDVLYHPVKSLDQQSKIRIRGYARPGFAAFAQKWIGEDSPAARDIALRWREEEPGPEREEATRAPETGSSSVPAPAAGWKAHERSEAGRVDNERSEVVCLPARKLVLSSSAHRNPGSTLAAPAAPAASSSSEGPPAAPAAPAAAPAAPAAAPAAPAAAPAASPRQIADTKPKARPRPAPPTPMQSAKLRLLAARMAAHQQGTKAAGPRLARW